MGLLDLTDECTEAIDQWSGVVGAPNPNLRKKERIEVFQNQFIESWFAISHPILPGVWFGPVIIAGPIIAGFDPTIGWGLSAALFAAGVLAWTLLEYVLHRWPFHYQPAPDFKSKQRVYLMHGYHHDFPNDKWRLVAPPLMSWPLAVVVGGVYRLALGPGLWLPFFSGTVAGYLAYDWTHYYTHHFVPTSRLGKWLRRLHMIHHFNNPEVNHGISSPLWDFVFRTYSDQKRAASGSQTVEL